MNKMELKIEGKSGKEYVFNIYPLSTSLVGKGVYLFIKVLKEKNENGHNCLFIYLGITENLSTRFNNHHKEKCIKDNGATHIGVIFEDDEDERKNIEKDILGNIITKCNDKMN